MKKTLKLIPAIVMLLVSAILVSTSTYAWFSMNNKVTVTGMQVNTKVSSNLLIAPDTLGATPKKGDEEFTDELSQPVVGILEPVSTADAINFFYSTDAAASGKKIGSSAYTQYSSSATPVGTDSSAYADLFSEEYGVTKSAATATYNYRAVPYVDYVFQLKATNSKNTDQVINLTKLDLKYAGATDNSKAHRIAVFVQDITSTASSADPTVYVGTYTVASSANWDDKVISGTATTDDADYISSATALVDPVPANTTKWYKVIVRMWLEGQDKTCNNETFLSLTNDWSLDIELALEDNLGGVANINKLTTP